MRTSIVSAADAKYFPLLKGLVLSIIEQRSDQELEIAALDVGLSVEQIQELQSLGVVVRNAEWDFDFPSRPTTPSWYRAMTARCCLPKYFPEFDILIWIDADAWLQDSRAIQLLIWGAFDGSLAIVPEFDRAYKHRIAAFASGDNENDLRESAYGQCVRSFGPEIGRDVGKRHVYNSGVFALRRDSPSWQKWAHWMQIALNNGSLSLTDQNALNAAIYKSGIPVISLPAWCNWLCNLGGTAYNLVDECFVSPELPHERISILHVTTRQEAVTDMIINGEKIILPRDYLEHKAAVAKFKLSHGMPVKR